MEILAVLVGVIRYNKSTVKFILVLYLRLGMEHPRSPEPEEPQGSDCHVGR